MTVLLNGSPVVVPGPATLADLLAGQEIRGTAVALNGVVVPRHRLAVQPLAEGDQVEWVTAVQGG
jgi:thiamine biosynthesis protein ThiS